MPLLYNPTKVLLLLLLFSLSSPLTMLIYKQGQCYNIWLVCLILGQCNPL